MHALPTIPEDTRRAAHSLYGNGNFYLRLGDHLNTLWAELYPLKAQHQSKEFGFTLDGYLCALLTVVQYIEELPNQSMLEVLRTRVDLRYALHLPLNSPGIHPSDLCAYRKQLLSDAALLRKFQALLDRLNEFGLFAMEQGKLVNAQDLVNTVCTINCFDEVMEAMYRAIECLAVTDPEWLRQVAIPQWYERYSRQRMLPRIAISDPKWNTRILHVGADIRYLLGKIDQSNNLLLSSKDEIKEIRRIWDEQFMLVSKDTERQPFPLSSEIRCSSCRILSTDNYSTYPTKPV
ncbi:MAG: hypothetical protein MUC85_05640 [Anaerolineales bacterium]|nr:hypothetical protein [Anaerolineales bacterium]